MSPVTLGHGVPLQGLPRQQRVCDMSRAGARGPDELGSRDEQGVGRGAVGIQSRPRGLCSPEHPDFITPSGVFRPWGAPGEAVSTPGKLDSLPGL